MAAIRADVVPTHTPALFQAAVNRAAEQLRSGDIVAVPTETVYGLAANAFDSKAVSRIFEIKGRPAHNPIIIHVASLAMAESCVSHWPSIAEKLSRAFWPGPLTVVLPRSKEIPDVVTAGGPTVGIRWPGHPFMQAVIRECGFPLAAPSANLSNELSPTNAWHVEKSLGNKIHLIIDGGHSQIGIESTVLDLTATPPRLLRPGMIHEEALLAVTGSLTVGSGDGEEILKSPGQLQKHYSPRAKLVVCSWQDDEDLKAQIPKLKSQISNLHVIAHTHIPSGLGFVRVSIIPHNPEAFGRALYAELHQCDEAGADLIIVEAVPESHEWRAIADRLKRAAS